MMGNKTIIIEFPENVSWLNQQINDFDEIEKVKIDGKVLEVPRIVAMLLQKLQDQNNDSVKQIEILRKALKLHDHRKSL